MQIAERSFIASLFSASQCIALRSLVSGYLPNRMHIYSMTDH